MGHDTIRVVRILIGGTSKKIEEKLKKVRRHKCRWCGKESD